MLIHYAESFAMNVLSDKKGRRNYPQVRIYNIAGNYGDKNGKTILFLDQTKFRTKLGIS